MSIIRFSILFALLFTFFSCQKDEAVEISEDVRQFPKVDKALWPYFERFEKEAALRGLSIDLVAAGIIGEIAELPEEHVAGQCTYGSAIDEHIIIDKTFWNSSANDFIREMVVFHELGHCYLFRKHREGAYANGSCISIMRSGSGGCFDNYHAATRSIYLDELFDLNNP